MNIGEIMASSSRRVFFLYYDEYNTSTRAWQILFNGDCDLLMKKDRKTFYKFNYEGVNNFGDYVFDEVKEIRKSYCCFSKPQRSRYRLLFTKRGRELVATHVDKIRGHRAQYIVDI